MTKEEIIKEYLETWQYVEESFNGRLYIYKCKPLSIWNDNEICKPISDSTWDAAASRGNIVLYGNDQKITKLLKVWELTENATPEDFV